MRDDKGEESLAFIVMLNGYVRPLTGLVKSKDFIKRRIIDGP